MSPLQRKGHRKRFWHREKTAGRRPETEVPVSCLPSLVRFGRWLVALMMLGAALLPVGLVHGGRADKRLLLRTESLTAEHLIYQRFYNGLPVFDGDIRVHIDKHIGEQIEAISGVDPIEIGQGDGYYTNSSCKWHIL